MSVLVIGMVWLLNLVISFWNARVTGLCWVESKMIGGFTRFMCWMGAIMAACGFTWCLLIFLVLGGHQFYPEYVTTKVVTGSLSLGYLVIIPAVLFSGLMIMVESWVEAWRRRDLPSMGRAAWNTFAQIYNSYEAIEGIPKAFSSVMDIFSGDDDDSIVPIVIGFVLAALVGGVLVTAMIIHHYAASKPLPRRYEGVPAGQGYGGQSG